jgi:hypothetical protein
MVETVQGDIVVCASAASNRSLVHCLGSAVMGLVIFGHQWQHKCCQKQRLQLQLCSKDEVLAWKLLLCFKKTNEHLSIIDVHPVIRLVLRKGNLEIADSLFS